MAGQKARIDKDSNVYLSKNARPEAEAETAYDSNDELESDDLSNDRNGNGPDVFKGSTKKDRSRKADQVTTGTEGDMGSALEKMENSNPFFNTLRSRFFAEAENPGVAQAPATSDSPSLGMMAVNTTDFRQPKADVRSVLESIALQAAEAFELLDDNSEVPDAIVSELQNSAQVVTKVFDFANKNQSSDEAGDSAGTPAVAKDTVQGKPGVNEEIEELDELSRATISRYSLKAKSIADNEGGKDRSKGRELAGRKNWGGSMKGVERARIPSTNEEVEDLDEKLIGKQHKIDANKNGRLDAHDFKLLRAKKTMKEATDIVFKTLLKGRLDADN